MKKHTAILLLMLLSIAAIAQEKTEISPSQVPAEVKTSYQKDFPTAQLLNWEKEDGLYEATFKVDNVEMSAAYTKKGYRKEVEKDIDESKLPTAATDYLKKNYADYKLKIASQITTDKSVVTYEAEIIKDNTTLSLVFDENGKFKKKEKEKDGN